MKAVSILKMRGLNKTKQNLKKKKRKEKNEDLQDIEIRFSYMAGSGGREKEGVVGRAGESDQEVQ